MLKRWATVEETTGMIYREGQGVDHTGDLEQKLQAPGLLVFTDRPAEVSSATHYWNLIAEEWQERPTLPPFANPYDLTQLPPGTTVQVRDESGTMHEITDLSETLVLEGPQTYWVCVRPPAPYCKVILTEEVA